MESVVITDKNVFIKSVRLFGFGQEVLRDSNDHLIIIVESWFEMGIYGRTPGRLKVA